MIKRDIIIAAVFVGVYVTEVVFAGRAGALIGLINFIGGAFALWYYFMRKGVV